MIPPLSHEGATACTTADCRGRAVRYVSCEGEGAYPYCGECADLLTRHGETDHGSVDDPVVAENERLREALQFFADGGTYEEGGKVRAVPWPLQVRAREALGS